MFGWFRKKVKQVTLKFEVDQERMLKVSVDWPDCDDVESKVDIADALASLVQSLCDGDLLVSIQKAVAVTGAYKKDDGVAQHTLELLNQVVVSLARQSPDEDGPVIPAERGFMPND